MTTINIVSEGTNIATTTGTTNAQAVTTTLTTTQDFSETGTTFENSSDVTTFGPPSIITISTTKAPAVAVKSTVVSVYTSNIIIYSTIGIQPSSTPNSTTLSPGAETGIGVGVSLGCLLIVAAIAGFLWRRRYRRLKPRNAEVGYPELDGTSSVAVLGSKELSSSSIHEASSKEVPSEADYSTVRVELEGDWHGYEVLSPKCDMREKSAEKI